MSKLSHYFNLFFAKRKLNKKLFNMAFPKGLKQADRVIRSLASIYKIDLNDYSAQKYSDILSTYVKAVEANANGYNVPGILLEIHKSNKTLVPNKIIASDIYSLYLLNRLDKNFCLDNYLAYEKLGNMEKQVLVQVDNAREAAETGKIVKIQKENTFKSASEDYPPMKWYYFLIWWSLIVGGISSIAEGVGLVTGIGSAGYGYSFKDLYIMMGNDYQNVSVLYGIACIIFGVYSFVIRQNLAKYKLGAGKMYCTFLIAEIITVMVYSLLLYEYMETGYLIGRIIGFLIIYFANRIYFKKREHLFCN